MGCYASITHNQQWKTIRTFGCHRGCHWSGVTLQPHSRSSNPRWISIWNGVVPGTVNHRSGRSGLPLDVLEDVFEGYIEYASDPKRQAE